MPRARYCRDGSIYVGPAHVTGRRLETPREARREGELFGIDRRTAAALRLRDGSLEDLACGTGREAAELAQKRVIDDMAVLVVTFE